MKAYRYQIIVIVFILFVGVLCLLPAIPQDLAYHDFGDKRNFFGVPHFWDVMSNIPMFFIGVYGTWWSIKTWSNRPGFVAKWLPIVLCAGMYMACFGSMYYHWAPDNDTLVWDRLPMTLMFMPIFSLLLYDFVGRKVGEWAFFLLIPLGIFSVFYWQYTESIGEGDLRFYVFVQFFPMLIAPFILWLFPKKTSYVRYIWYILAWYIAAKLCEHFDKAIFEMLGFWSGHTLKHLISAVSLYYVLQLMMAWGEEFKKE